MGRDCYSFTVGFAVGFGLLGRRLILPTKQLTLSLALVELDDRGVRIRESAYWWLSGENISIPFRWMMGSLVVPWKLMAELTRKPWLGE